MRDSNISATNKQIKLCNGPRLASLCDRAEKGGVSCWHVCATWKDVGTARQATCFVIPHASLSGSDEEASSQARVFDGFGRRDGCDGKSSSYDCDHGKRLVSIKSCRVCSLHLPNLNIGKRVKDCKRKDVSIVGPNLNKDRRAYQVRQTRDRPSARYPVHVASSFDLLEAPKT